MQLITLNTWGGRLGEPRLRDFFEKYRSADVFCLQEIWQTQNLSLAEELKVDGQLFSKIVQWLPQHRGFFRPQYRGIYGLATFVHERHEVESEGEIFVFKDRGYENPRAMGNHARNLQYLHLRMDGKPLCIANFHGLWNGEGKTDTPDRIAQSQKIASFLETFEPTCLIAGDFNLVPETESLKIIEDVCPQNLIREYAVPSTRSSLYSKPGRFADYIFLGEGLEARSFEVLPDEVSDHLALRVNFVRLP